MPNNAPKNILIAPLDWGAGHTTRCMPVIEHLLRLGNKVFVAGNGAQQAMVRETFGNRVTLLQLEGYDISYSPINKYAQAGLLLQMPRVLQAIKREHQWLQEIVLAQKIDGVISDNRYGLYHAQVPSVIMTHQLQVLSDMGNVADNMVRRLHYRYLEKFSGIWVVDATGGSSLAGKLAQVAHMPKNTQYMGLLSRFADDGYDYSNTQAYALLVLLSGPEPQRSILSGILWKQLVSYEGKVIFAEGSDNAIAPEAIPIHITYYKRLAGAELKQAMRAAMLVICRSGYSTLMDLAAIGKPAILIPTPGQTEQEYLGKKMHESGVHYTMPQEAFHLPTAIAGAAKLQPPSKTNADAYMMHRHLLEKWLETL